MKNIGIIVDNEFDTDIRVQKEVEILKKNGWNIFVLCFAFDNKEYPSYEDLNVIRISISRKKKNGLFFLMNTWVGYERLWTKNIIQFVNENNINLLHVHDLYMSKCTYSAIKKTNQDIPIILDLHENFPYAIQSYNWTKGWLRSFLSKPHQWIKKEKEYLSYASRLVVLSDFYKRELLDKYDFLQEEKIISFSNVIDLGQFEQFTIDTSLQRSDKVTLTYFGAVAERRGIFETLLVLERVLKEGLDIKLLIIGPIDKADKARFFNMINQNTIKNNVEYIPWIDLSELVSYMSISDIFLSPLHKNKQHESGVANKIFQYMYGAKPIIVSNCKPQQELIKSFECGLSYTTQEEYFECVTKLVKNESLRIKLGNNGCTKLYEEYGGKKYENIFLSLYEDLFVKKK